MKGMFGFSTSLLRAALAGGFALILLSWAGAPDAQAATESVVYSFTGGADGATPVASLIYLGSTFYGTTPYGGAHGHGTVFSVTPAGKEKVLHAFTGGADGANPEAGLINVGSTLYGTASFGGTYGSGTVFSLTKTGENVVYSFAVQGSGDGNIPFASLINVGGALYGTATGGGTGDDGNGTVDGRLESTVNSQLPAALCRGIL